MLELLPASGWDAHAGGAALLRSEAPGFATAAKGSVWEMLSEGPVGIEVETDILLWI